MENHLQQPHPLDGITNMNRRTPLINVGSRELDMSAYARIIYGDMRVAKTASSVRNIPKICSTPFPLKGTISGRWASYNGPTVPSRRRRNKRERKKGMKHAQFFIRHRMLMPEEIKGIQQGTMEIRRSHILDYDNNRMALLYKNRADEIHGRRLLEIEEDTWKELTYDIEEPEPKRHFPGV